MPAASNSTFGMSGTGLYGTTSRSFSRRSRPCFCVAARDETDAEPLAHRHRSGFEIIGGQRVMETGSCHHDARQPVDVLGRAKMTPRDDLLFQSSTGVSRRLMMWGLLGLASCTNTSAMPPAPPTPPLHVSRLAAPPPYRLQV